MGLFIRTIGIERAKAKIGLANIAFNYASSTGRTERPRRDQATPEGNRAMPKGRNR